MNEISEGRSITVDMARQYGMDPSRFEQTLRKTVFPATASPEELAAFLQVARVYKLNPFQQQIYAFPKRGGGIQPIVPIDGWMKIVNDHPAMDGMEFQDNMVEGRLFSITCQIFRKDRSHPTIVTEYMGECVRDSEPWKKWPARMLRHKAAIQCARYAFSFSGIVDPDEYDRGVGLVHKGKEKPLPLKEALTKSIELLDAETGEIIDEIPEHGGGDEVEKFISDPNKYLDGLDAQMAGCKTDSDLDEVWAEHMTKQKELFPPDQDRAQTLFERYEARLKADAKVPRKK